MQKRKLLFFVFAAILAAWTILPSSSFAALEIAGEDEVAQGDTVTYTVVDSMAPAIPVPGDYTWTFSNGTPKIAIVQNQATIDWTADFEVASAYSPDQVVVQIAQGGVYLYTKNVEVYFPIVFLREGNIPKVLLPGQSTTQSGEQLLEAAGGRMSTYEWWQDGPAFANPVIFSTQKTATFNAPSDGTYAGVYTITVKDGLSDPQSVFIAVPCVIEDGPLYFQENSNPVVYTITGMPDGTNYNVRMTKSSNPKSTDLTGNPNTGNVVPQAGPSVNGIYNFTYFPPADATKVVPFYFQAEPDKTLDYAEYGNLYQPVPYGVMAVRLIRNFAGKLIDADTHAPLAGATVTLFEPQPFAQELVTNFNGEFEFTDFPAGNVFSFCVGMPGYEQLVIKSSELAHSAANPAVIPVAPNTTMSFASGNIVMPDGSLPGPNQVTTVALLAENYTTGLTRVTDVQRLGEIQVVGSLFYIDVMELPQVNPDALRLVAYQTSNYTDTFMWLAGPIGTYPNMTLKLINKYNVFPDGTWPTDTTFSGGYRMEAENRRKKDGIVIETLPAGFVEILGAGIDISKLVGNDPQTAMIIEVVDTPYYSTKQTGFTRASPSLLRAQVFDKTGDQTSPITTERGMKITIPIILEAVPLGSYARDETWLRASNSEFSWVSGCRAIVIPNSQITSVDYLGDGRYGWVTFYVNPDQGRWFATGLPCDDNDSPSGPFKWPEFDRYELFGCFIRSIE